VELYFNSLLISVIQKGTTYSGIRLFNSLPGFIQNLRNDKSSS
jgi:hypothetical protein